jgi:hypothetical protein
VQVLSNCSHKRQPEKRLSRLKGINIRPTSIFVIAEIYL